MKLNSDDIPYLKRNSDFNPDTFDAYQAGKSSWHNGVSENDCPYPHLSVEWADWMAGFEWARDNESDHIM